MTEDHLGDVAKGVATTAVKPRKTSWKRRALYFLLCGALILLVGVASCGYYVRNALKDGGYFENWDEEIDGEALLDVRYGDEEYQVFDAYVPKNRAPEKLRGAALFIHGGAWVGGSRAEQVGFAKRAAKAGYLSFNMEYLLYSEDTKEEYTIEAVLDDVDKALEKAKEIGAKYGYRLDRVALSGHSAGGHIASLYAYKRGKTAPLPVKFVMARVAPIDFHYDAWSSVQKSKTVATLVSAMTGAELTADDIENPTDETEALIDSISPLSYVKPGVTPTIAAYASKDILVGTGHKDKLTAAFEKLGAKSIAEVAADDSCPVFDFVEFPNSNHMLGRDPDRTMRLWGLFLKYSERYLHEIPTEEAETLEEWGEAVERRALDEERRSPIHDDDLEPR